MLTPIPLIGKIVLAMAALFMSVSFAFAALTLDSAKAQGLVGERPDGLLGIVSQASPDVSTLVSTTNTERLEKYKSIAQKNGTALPQVQALAGKNLIERTAPGQYFMNAAGVWQKK